MATSPPPVLVVGLPAEIEGLISDILKNAAVSSIPLEMDALIAEASPSPCLVISGPPKPEIPATEIAQALRMQFQELPLILCCTQKEGFERKAFIKNGFTDAFLLPMDTANLRAFVSERLAEASKGEIRVFRPVKIIDLEPGATLDFETHIFLPANKRYVKLSTAGDSLESDRIDRIKKSKFNTIQVPAEQMKHFYSYSAKRLRDLGGGPMSVTEKREKLSGAVRDLISGLFSEQTSSFDSGQAMMKDCGEIVKTYIIEGAEGEWYSRIQSVLGERGDNYSHSANISTLAALFSMGLGVGKPEDLALAGLLHDIGIAELPAEIQMLEPEQMSPAQLEIYKKHPEHSVNLIKSRKLIVSDIVTKAILQH
ncbi:HD domain-containing protein, partial [bacterium]|nr:HD domain-containing protein [bacterium]